MQKQGYDCECLGGGRISHQSQDKKIHVYGYSMVSRLASPHKHPLQCQLQKPIPGPGPSRSPRDVRQDAPGWLPPSYSGLSPGPTPRGLARLPLLQFLEAGTIGVQL